MRHQSVMAVALALVAGCSSVEPGSVRVRVVNASAEPFSSVSVAWTGAPVTYGPLAAGATSDYVTVAGAYRYGYVSVVTATDTLVIQPIDYVGETPLRRGNYTYVLDVQGAGWARYVALAFQPDD